MNLKSVLILVSHSASCNASTHRQQIRAEDPLSQAHLFLGRLIQPGQTNCRGNERGKGVPDPIAAIGELFPSGLQELRGLRASSVLTRKHE